MLFYRVILWVVVLSVLLGSCASLPSGKASSSDLAELEEKVENRNFNLVSNWAFPLMTQGITSVANSGLLLPGSSANRIDIMGNVNYFKVRGDSVLISLPYFGERQIGGGYADRDVGIRFEGVPQDYLVKKEGDQINIEINVKDRSETLRFNLFLFPSGKAEINMNSSHRSSIRYSGRLVRDSDN